MRGSLGDAGGSGVNVLDQIVPELDVSRAEYERLREHILDQMGLIPHAIQGPVVALNEGRARARFGHAPSRPPTRAEVNAALQNAEWWPVWWQGRPPTARVTPGGGPYRDIYVNLAPLSTVTDDGARVLQRPSDPAVFTPPFVPGVYGPDNVRWVDLPAGSLVLVRWPGGIFPDDSTIFAGAPTYQIPVWFAGHTSLVSMAAIPARRAGVSTGDRHDLILLRDGSGAPIGYIGSYEPGGSGNEFQSGVGRFLAREVAGGIAQAFVTVVGNIVTPGAGFTEGEAAGHFVSHALDAAIDVTPTSVQPLVTPLSNVARVAEGAVPTGVSEIVPQVTIEVAHAVSPAAADKVFADAAVLSTNLAGLDNLLLGLGDIFRAMAVAMQSGATGAALARDIAANQQRLAAAGGQALQLASMVVQMAANLIVAVATAGAAAPYIAAAKAAESALLTAYAGGDMATAGAKLMTAAAAFVPVVGSELAVLGQALEKVAVNDPQHGAAMIGQMVLGFIPVVGDALAKTAKTVVLIADTQDRMRQAELANDRMKAANALAQAAARSAEAPPADHADAVQKVIAEVRAPAERSILIVAAQTAALRGGGATCKDERRCGGIGAAVAVAAAWASHLLSARG